MYEKTESAVRLFTIRCFGREVGRLPEILAILADYSPEYSLRDQNCWQYTRWTARRLMQRCQQQGQGQGQLSDEELRLLQIEEDSIETNCEHPPQTYCAERKEGAEEYVLCGTFGGAQAKGMFPWS